jgi:hypothetical protein
MAEPKPQEITEPELADALARLGAAIKANPTKHEPSPSPPAKVIQLPLWPEAAPGMPNPVIRSALFPAIQSKKRRLLDREKIPALEGVRVFFRADSGTSRTSMLPLPCSISRATEGAARSDYGLVAVRTGSATKYPSRAAKSVPVAPVIEVIAAASRCSFTPGT